MRKLAVGIAIGASAFLATQALVSLGAFDDVELTAYDRRLVATHNPADAIATVATARRRELDDVKRAPGAVQAPLAASLLDRMKTFFRIY